MWGEETPLCFCEAIEKLEAVSLFSTGLISVAICVC